MTRKDHEAVEGAVALDRPDFSLADYRRFLEVMLAAHEPFEQGPGALPELAAFLPDLAERAKAASLRSDLRTLGSDPPFLEPLTSSVGEALGALYVLEGSTLGARFVLASIRARFGAAVDGATSYLEGSGENRAQRWQEFGRALERAATLRPEIVAGARHTFARVRKLFVEKV